MYSGVNVSETSQPTVVCCLHGGAAQRMRPTSAACAQPDRGGAGDDTPPKVFLKYLSFNMQQMIIVFICGFLFFGRKESRLKEKNAGGDSPSGPPPQGGSVPLAPPLTAVSIGFSRAFCNTDSAKLKKSQICQKLKILHICDWSAGELFAKSYLILYRHTLYDRNCGKIAQVMIHHAALWHSFHTEGIVTLNKTILPILA